MTENPHIKSQIYDTASEEITCTQQKQPESENEWQTEKLSRGKEIINFLKAELTNKTNNLTNVGKGCKQETKCY